MSESKRDYVKDCVASNATGKHEYVTQTFGGEICKHCGLLRDTIEFCSVPVGAILSPLSAEIIAGVRMGQVERTAKEMAGKIVADKPNVPDHIFNDVLRTTGAKAAIIITFDEPIMTSPFLVSGFHISAVNVVFANIQSVVRVVAEALSGRLGGKMDFRHGEEPPKV